MPVTYCVFIGEDLAIDALVELNSAVKALEYSPGMKIVPYTSDLHLALCKEYGENPPGGDLEESDSMNKAMSSLVTKASLKGKIAYIFEEHFGGCRDSESILWENGQIIYGPSLKYEDQLKVMEMLLISKENLYGFTKYDHPDDWLQDKNC